MEGSGLQVQIFFGVDRDIDIDAVREVKIGR